MSKKKVSKKEEIVNVGVRKLAAGYIFLLIAFSLFFVCLHSFNLYAFDIELNYSIFILPILFFLIDVILKEVGYSYGIAALVLSAAFIFVAYMYLDILFNIEFNMIKYIGVVLAYSVSQFLNLSIYYYMLDNYRTPYFFVVVNFIFSILIYNMIYMLFSLGLVFSDGFWSSYLIVVALQTLISMICGILLRLIKQGVEG